MEATRYVLMAHICSEVERLRHKPRHYIKAVPFSCDSALLLRSPISTACATRTNTHTANSPPNTPSNSTYARPYTQPFEPHDHTTMADFAASNTTSSSERMPSHGKQKRKSTSSSAAKLTSWLAILLSGGWIPTSSNTTIATHTAPSVATSVVRTTTAHASQVFYTPELLDLILSNLETRELLVTTSLVCRTFKATIDSSPTLNKALESAVTDAIYATYQTGAAGKRLQSNCQHCGIFRVSFSTTRVTCFLAMKCSTASLERYISSPSFRKLRIPRLRLSRGNFSVNGVNQGVYLRTTMALPYVHDENTVTVAEQLEEVISQAPFGMPVTPVVMGFVLSI
jgi:hypothetical protein